MGSPVDIARQGSKLSVALTNSYTTSPEIDIRDKAFGSVIVPAASGITSLQFYAAETQGGTYVPIADVATMAVTAGNAYKIDDKVFGYGYIRIVANTSASVFIVSKS